MDALCWLWLTDIIQSKRPITSELSFKALYSAREQRIQHGSEQNPIQERLPQKESLEGRPLDWECRGINRDTFDRERQ